MVEKDLFIAFICRERISLTSLLFIHTHTRTAHVPAFYSQICIFVRRQLTRNSSFKGLLFHPHSTVTKRVEAMTLKPKEDVSVCV